MRNESYLKGLGALFMIGFFLVVLKLSGMLTWPWLFVTFPFWGLIAFGVIVVMIPSIFLLLGYIWKRYIKKQYRRKR